MHFGRRELSHGAVLVASGGGWAGNNGYFFAISAKKITHANKSKAEIANANFCHGRGTGRGFSSGSSGVAIFGRDDLLIVRQALA
jgi:hypothetical protein